MVVSQFGGMAMLFGIELPVIQAPMAGPVNSEMGIVVSEVSGLGSLPCSMLNAAPMRAELEMVRRQTRVRLMSIFPVFARPRSTLSASGHGENAGRATTKRWGLDPETSVSGTERTPFGSASCDLVEEFKPATVGFQFGLPNARELASKRRVRSSMRPNVLKRRGDAEFSPLTWV